MAEHIRPDKQILVTLFGLTTTLIVGGVLGYIEATTGFALYSFMFLLIFPVGAILAGFGAASGYFASALLFNQKPAGGALLNMVGASIGAFFIVHYVPYLMIDVEGTPLKEIIPFWKYLDIDIRSTSLSISRGKVTTGELGSFFGYVYAILQLGGFSIGGFLVFDNLSSKLHCDTCSLYLKKTGEQYRFTSSGEKLSEQILEFVNLVNCEQCNDAIKYHAENMGVKEESGHHLCSQIITRKCEGCGLNHLYFITGKLEENNWKDINETEMSLFTNEQLSVAD